MPFQPFTPPTSPEYPDWWVVTPSRALPPPQPPQVVIPVSGLPTTPKRGKRWPWLVIFLVLCVFEPVRILGITLVFFWILAIGLMPHVAIMKVATGGHRR